MYMFNESSLRMNHIDMIQGNQKSCWREKVMPTRKDLIEIHPHPKVMQLRKDLIKIHLRLISKPLEKIWFLKYMYVFNEIGNL